MAEVMRGGGSGDRQPNRSPKTWGSEVAGSLEGEDGAAVPPPRPHNGQVSNHKGWTAPSPTAQQTCERPPPQSGGMHWGVRGLLSQTLLLPGPCPPPHLKQGSPQNEIPHQGDLLSASGLQKTQGLGPRVLKASLPSSHALAWAGSRSPDGSNRKACFCPSGPPRTLCLLCPEAAIPWSMSQCPGDVQERHLGGSSSGHPWSGALQQGKESWNHPPTVAALLR